MVRSTRRQARKSKSTATRRMRGGSRHEECQDLLKKCIVDDYDYERMQDYTCDAIEEGKSYEEFVEHNMAVVDMLSDEDCDFFINVCNKIKGGKLHQMDLERCSVFRTSRVFFDKQGGLVIVNPR